MPGPLPKSPLQLTPEQERHLQQLSSCYTARTTATIRVKCTHRLRIRLIDVGLVGLAAVQTTLRPLTKSEISKRA